LHLRWKYTYANIKGNDNVERKVASWTSTVAAYYYYTVLKDGTLDIQHDGHNSSFSLGMGHESILELEEGILLNHT
jgi:hypothetical protein